jgi:hypothetical protein
MYPGETDGAEKFSADLQLQVINKTTLNWQRAKGEERIPSDVADLILLVNDLSSRK